MKKWFVTLENKQSNFKVLYDDSLSLKEKTFFKTINNRILKKGT